MGPRRRDERPRNEESRISGDDNEAFSDDFAEDELVWPVPLGLAESSSAPVREGLDPVPLAPDPRSNSELGSSREESGDLTVRELVVPESAEGERLDFFLTQVTDGFSREQIRKAVQDDAAEVDGKIRRPSFRVRAGQRIRFRVPPPPTDGPVPEAIPLEILYEDDGMVIVNKPAGMVVHPARGNWTGTLTSALAYHFQSLSDVGGPTRPGIVHRLDRDTSGVIAVAKTNAVHMHLAAQWAARTVTKTYVSICCGPLDHDRDVIDAPIGRHPYQREKMAIRAGHETSKPARTFYEVLERFSRFTLVRLNPETGRTHQIRVHMEHRGCPVLCDRLYGGRSVLTVGQLARLVGVPDSDVEAPQSILLDRQALHAARLEIDHPQTGRRMVFEAPLPPDMMGVIEQLRRWV